jgi:hypothetical protein
MTGRVMKTLFPEADASYRFDLEGIGFVEAAAIGAMASTAAQLRAVRLFLTPFE